MEGWDQNDLQALDRAIDTGDGSIVELVSGRLADEILQHAGDGLLEALAEGVEAAAQAAEQCAAALRERGWEGDAELADQISAALHQGPTPMLRPLPVDLEMLAEILEGDPTWGGGRIDLNTGDCWPGDSDYDDGDGEDEDRWLYVECVGSREGYWDMERFIATVEDAMIANRLEIVIRGKGAFRRFKDVLSRWPDELQRYFQFASERQIGRARAWLAEEGYRPTVPSRAAK